MTILFKYIYIVTALSACNFQKKENENHIVHEDCISLNNEAIALFTSWEINSDQTKLDSAFMMIDSAVKCDDQFLSAITNQFSFNFRTERFTKCFIPLEKMRVITKEEDPFPLAYLSICYKKTGNLLESEKCKNLALSIAQTNFNNDSSISNYETYIVVHHDMEEKQEAKRFLIEHEYRYKSDSNRIQFLKDWLEQ